ncbi:MAG: hypothetical protein WC326_08645 [Candidatus Delongbacteria bacterium]
MKKLLTLALTGVLAAAALAVESEPSNTVGFISRSTTAGSYTAFSACPKGLGVDMPAVSVLGTQGFNGDQILAYDGGWLTYSYTPDNTWGGLTLDYNGMYIYRNNHGAAATLVVAGDVIPEGTNVTLATFPGANTYVGFGNPLPMDVDLDTNDLTLVADGFNTGDIVLEYNGGWLTYVYSGSFGYDLTAGRSYVMRTGAAFTWDYTIPTGAVATTSTAPMKVAKAATSVELN